MTRWRWAALAAVATILTGLSFGLVPASDACRAVAAHPWAEFQQVATPHAATTLIDACGAGRLRSGMWIDALAFIPVYAAFLLASLWAARPQHLVGLAMVALLSVGVFADQIEGFRLLAMIDANGGTTAMVAAANRATFAKELFLAAATGAVGLAVFGMRDWRRYAGALVVAGAAIVVVALFTHRPTAPVMLVLWLTLAVVALTGALRSEVPADRNGAISPR
ncbi:hypothetical protein [Sphingomonas sp. SUN039]|uniref:hypothetical protein n=1 Tax=Sphingomonas sp. SUN039 TaxID=2937787 RepID=UPI002164252F|nr:hypothetical protein [Sphingomonas sp. SUN039]UVO55567.1 hypothetical protein M0209_16105 [Sphingomonas sp. SUN039]